MMTFYFDSKKQARSSVDHAELFIHPRHRKDEVCGLMNAGRFTLERDYSILGVNWKRGCYWAGGERSRGVEFGSYQLRKIVHTDGTPLQPAFDDYVAMRKLKHGREGILLWKGWRDCDGDGLPDPVHAGEDDEGADSVAEALLEALNAPL